MDALDQKLTQFFEGRVVRKDLLHRIKKGTNVPTFVLEFLLARYCASEDAAEIQAGMEAVLATLQDNYVRPDEANAAQSKVATKGRYKFIDKVHVNYLEKEKRHWAALENFASQRIAVSEKFYRDNDRLLEGGVWAEVTLAYNDLDQDNYAFFVEELRPIQLSRFDFNRYGEGRAKFSRDEWLDVILRSVGLEPAKLSPRLKFHFIARLAPLVEANFNFIELGPRGTGKSYFFSEFSPYSTLVSGGQGTKATLFYNNARRKIGLVGFWDTVAFDEVGNIKIKDQDSIQIMKDYMANGRFSRGVEVIADASLAFVGNIDQSIYQLVNSTDYDLFLPLPKEFDLAIMDRLACYLPGWEMPKTGSEYLTDGYGFITDYLAEAFHYQLKHTNRYEEVNKRIRLGPMVEGRDEKAIKKIVCAFLKILHPLDQPTDEEFEQYVAYAVEARRRVKEQMNKRKPDDEFAKINLSYFTAEGKEVVVFCPESKDAPATQEPVRRSLMLHVPEPEQTASSGQDVAPGEVSASPDNVPSAATGMLAAAPGAVPTSPAETASPEGRMNAPKTSDTGVPSVSPPLMPVMDVVKLRPVESIQPGSVRAPGAEADTSGQALAAESPLNQGEILAPVDVADSSIGAIPVTPDRPMLDTPVEPREQHFTIPYDGIGYSYDSIFAPYLGNAIEIVVEDPYIRMPHQIQNFVRFCETVLKHAPAIRKITLVTSYDDRTNVSEMRDHLEEVKQSLLDQDVVLDLKLNPNLHDREIRLDNGWVIKIGRGLDFYQKPNSWYEIGVSDLALRKCLETKVDIYHTGS